jgi:hypothetical protein
VLYLIIWAIGFILVFPVSAWIILSEEYYRNKNYGSMRDIVTMIAAGFIVGLFWPWTITFMILEKIRPKYL